MLEDFRVLQQRFDDRSIEYVDTATFGGLRRFKQRVEDLLQLYSTSNDLRKRPDVSKITEFALEPKKNLEKVVKVTG